MKRFFKPCSRYREGICLLASGALPEDEKAQAQAHLASCAECRNYFNEIKAVTAPLANWEKSFAQIEADAALKSRWMAAIRTETSAKSPEPLSVRTVLQNLWRELLFPVRWHLAGMGALWMIAALLNIEPSTRPVSMAQKSVPARQILAALRENRRQLSELINPPTAESDALPETFVPRRRSEIQLPTAMA